MRLSKIALGGEERAQWLIADLTLVPSTPLGISQLPVTQVPGGVLPSSEHRWYTCTYSGTHTQTHDINKENCLKVALLTFDLSFLIELSVIQNLSFSFS